MEQNGHKRTQTTSQIFFDNLLFAGALLTNELFALHGKSLAMYFFDSKNGLHYRAETYPVLIHVTLLVSSVLFFIIKANQFSPRLKIIMSASVGFMSATIVQIGDTPSSLIFFLQLIIYAIACGILWVDSYFQEVLDRESWKFIFDNTFASVRYMLIGYGAMVAMLKYISPKNHESVMGFITTLAYPTIIIMLSIFMIGYWILVPAWESYLEKPGTVPLIERDSPDQT